MPQIKKSKRATRRDVARLAGVSLTTVTHALNNTPGSRLLPATVKRVKAAAAELNYRPNFVGKVLITGRNFTVGLLQPSYKSVFSGFYQRIVYGLVETMAQDDYNMVTMFRSEERRYLKSLQQGRVDGMMILQSGIEDGDIRAIIDSAVPTVVINRSYNCEAETLVGNVVSDHRQFMQEALEYFVDQGCKTVLAFHDYCDCEPNRQLNDAFVDIINHQLNNTIIGSAMIPARENLAGQIRDIFHSGQHWDGIMVDGFHVAEIILREAAAVGLQCPRDFKLVVEDCYECPIAHQLSGAVCYIQSPVEVGAAAWQLMHKLINNQAVEHEIAIPYKKLTIE